MGPLWRAALGASALVVGVLAVPTESTAAPTYSQFNPPPVCSEAPPGWTGPCIWQPDAFVHDSDLPILVDMPVMTRDLTSDGQVDPTGRVTFTITQLAGPPSGKTAGPPRWPSVIDATPIGFGYTAVEAEIFLMGREGSCRGTLSCTYLSYEQDPAPGWYRADNDPQIVGQHICPSPNPSGGLGGCLSTLSESAFYVPDTRDIPPPVVMADLDTSGLTVKAVATARDPAKMPLTLTWDFGDGTTVAGAPGQVVTHTYEEYGDYSVTARVEAEDGRSGSDSHEAGLSPPAPTLQAVTRTGSTTTGTATATLQAWPASSYVLLRYWPTGCPADPAADAPAAPSAHTQWTAAQPDGTVSVSLTNLPLAANAFVLQARSDVTVDGQVRSATGVSNCVTSVGTESSTSAATTAGEDEVPVDSSSVPVGNVAVIDAGTPDAEQRLVTGHGSLILESGLSRAHAAGAKVVDAGDPVPAYVAPGPPANPVPPTLPPDHTGYTPPTGGGGGGGGGGVPTAKAPAAPGVKKTTAKPGKKVVVKLAPGPDGGSTVKAFTVRCSPSGGGKVRSATGPRPKLTVTKLKAGKKYRCQARATNAVGTSPWGKQGKKVTALG